jgi:hypothetical protein
MTAEQRRAALWIFSLFFHGEQEVADDLSAFIAAAPTAEQRYFLMTQQVDEARHTVFFNRFMHEVAGLGDGTAASGLSATTEQLTWGHRQLFGKLRQISAELRDDPSPRRLGAAVALYHIVAEAGLAQAGQHVLERGLSELDILPAFREGLRRVAFDEQRHIGFGVKLLSDLLEQDPQGVQDEILALFAEILPAGAALARPPDWDTSYVDSLGFTLAELYEQSAAALEGRLRATGLPVDEIPRFPVPFDIPPRQRADDMLKLMRAGLLGSAEDRASPDSEALAIYFDLVRRRGDPTQVAPGTIIQWDFTDADPWHIEFSDGGARAIAGRAPKPDLTLRVALQDWIDMSTGRVSGPSLLLRRRLRPRGKLRVLGRMERVFA